MIWIADDELCQKKENFYMNFIAYCYNLLSSICVIFLATVLLIVIYRVLKIGILLLLDKLNS